MTENIGNIRCHKYLKHELSTGIIGNQDVKENVEVEPLFIVFASAPVEEAEEEMADGVPAVRRKNQPLASVTKVRSFFPETWLWMDVNARFVLQLKQATFSKT